MLCKFILGRMEFDSYYSENIYHMTIAKIIFSSIQIRKHDLNIVIKRNPWLILSVLYIMNCQLHVALSSGLPTTILKFSWEEGSI